MDAEVFELFEVYLQYFFFPVMRQTKTWLLRYQTEYAESLYVN